MTAYYRKRATKSAHTLAKESKMCALANARGGGPGVFWTPLELSISAEEGRYEARMVEAALNAAARRKDHVQP